MASAKNGPSFSASASKIVSILFIALFLSVSSRCIHTGMENIGSASDCGNGNGNGFGIDVGIFDGTDEGASIGVLLGADVGANVKVFLREIV